jgi:hypothetical protein
MLFNIFNIQGCPSLASLNLDGCDNLTTASLGLLFEDFPSLSRIVLSDRLMFEVTMLSFLMGLSEF